MLGFEQALRREPPAEIVAAEHVPERSLGGSDDGLFIDIPEPLDLRSPRRDRRRR